jgi:hypothetical protein
VKHSWTIAALTTMACSCPDNPPLLEPLPDAGYISFDAGLEPDAGVLVPILVTLVELDAGVDGGLIDAGYGTAVDAGRDAGNECECHRKAHKHHRDSCNDEWYFERDSAFLLW